MLPPGDTEVQGRQGCLKNCTAINASQGLAKEGEGSVASSYYFVSDSWKNSVPCNREDAEVQWSQSHTKPRKASPALCASKLIPLIWVLEDASGILLRRRRRISGDTVACLQILVFLCMKGPWFTGASEEKTRTKSVPFLISFCLEDTW